MKNYLLFILFIILAFSPGLYSQSINQPVYNNEGFYAGVAIVGASWSVENSDAEGGGGIGLKIGYNFNPNLGIFISLDGAGVNPDGGDTYGLAHFDIGIEGIFRSITDRTRPFVRGSLVGLGAANDDFEISGGGMTLGGGLLISLTEKLYFDLGLNYSFVNLTEFKLGSQSIEIDQDANSARFLVGLIYNF